MAFFQDLGKKVSQTSQDAVKKTKIMAETAKINSHIEGERRSINETYNKLGKRYFELFPDTSDENLKEFCEAVRESLRKIEEYQEQIKQLKGITACPNCGAEYAEGTAFCTACGAKLAVSEAPEEERPAEPQDRVCSGCGQPLPEGTKFCAECGKKAD